METIGGFLRSQREKAGKSLDDVSGAIKVRASLLKDLEGDHFERLPGGVFLRGYVKSYMKAIGGDAERGMELLDATLAPASYPLAAGPAAQDFNAQSAPRKLKPLHLAAVILAVLGLAAAAVVSAGKFDAAPAVSAAETTDADSGTSRSFSPIKQ